MPRNKVKYNLGLNTAKDISELDNGELRVATGIHYKPGDPDMAHTLGGCSLLGTASTSACRGGAILQYDTAGTSRIAALSGTTLYTGLLDSDGGSIPDGFVATKTGMSASSTHLGAAHYNDKWYLCDGAENFVVKPDGTERSMGMSPPAIAPTVVAQSDATTIRAASDDNVTGFVNASLAYNTNSNDYASAILDGESSASIELAWSGTSDTGTDRFLSVRWALAGGQLIAGSTTGSSFDDVGGDIDAGFAVTIRVEYSEDAGLTYSDILSTGKLTRTRSASNITVPITDGLEIADALKIRVTVDQISKSGQAVFRLLDARAGSGTSTTNFTTDTGVYYAITEYDENAGTESTAVESELVTLAAQNSAIVTLPTTARNSRATHWVIYRTTDGGSLPSTLGEIGRTPITEGTWFDDFSDSPNDLALPPYPLLRGVAQQDASGLTPAFYDFNAAPPPLAVLRVFEGSFVGLSDASPRTMYYAAAGYPEAWPVINVVTSFPFEENDELVDCVALGQILLVAAKGLMMRLNSLPRLVNSVRDVSRVEPIRGAPGCVGRKALTAYTVSGTPMAAWISPLGIYITNGDTVRRISDDLDWSGFANADKSKWVLAWDSKRQCLEFSCSTTGGANDTKYLLHMAPEHAKEGGTPKVTGPHYRKSAWGRSVQIGGYQRLYSFSSTDGSVYIEDNGSADDSNSYDTSGTNPVAIETGKVYASANNFAVLDAFPYHSRFGGGTATIKFTLGNDRNGFEESQVRTINLGGSKAAHVDISRQGEWIQSRIDYTGQGSGAFGPTSVNIRKMGRSGTVKLN